MNDFLEQFNDVNTEQTFASNEVEKHKVLAILSYLPPLFFLPIIGDKNSTYCKFHANQSFTWFLLVIVVSIVRIILGFIPVLGTLLSLALSLLMIAIFVVYMIGAGKGKAYRLPFIGSLINIF